MVEDHRPDLRSPWLLAVWPGMGHVAVAAGYYLIARMRISLLTELNVRPLFESDHVVVQGGVIRLGRLPRWWFFLLGSPPTRGVVPLLLKVEITQWQVGL